MSRDAVPRILEVFHASTDAGEVSNPTVTADEKGPASLVYKGNRAFCFARKEPRGRRRSPVHLAAAFTAAVPRRTNHSQDKPTKWRQSDPESHRSTSPIPSLLSDPVPRVGIGMKHDSVSIGEAERYEMCIGCIASAHLGSTVTKRSSSDIGPREALSERMQHGNTTR
jgi:hypothetical protein